MLNIESDQASYYRERDERLLLALAKLAVTALRNAEQIEREQRQNKAAQTSNAGATTASATTRWGTLRISVEIEGHEPGAPLRAGLVYMLQVDIQLAPTEIAQVHSEASSDEVPLNLQVTLETDDLIIADQPGQAVLGQENVVRSSQAEQYVRLEKGAPTNQVLFQILPARAREASFVLEVSAGSMLLLQQRLGFTVEDTPPAEQQVSPSVNAPGAPAETSADDLALASAAQLAAGELHTVVIRVDHGGGYAIFDGAGQELVRINSTAVIAHLSTNAPPALTELIELRNSHGDYVYQDSSTQVDQAMLAGSIGILSGLATRLSADVFPGRQVARNVNALLRSQAGSGRLRIQVVDKQYLMPWQLLADDEPAETSPLRFWGMRHQIDYTPENPEPRRAGFDPEIVVRDFEELELAFVHAGEHDPQLGSIIADERERLRGLPGLRMREYTTTRELAELLGNPDSPTQIIYIFTSVGVLAEAGVAKQVRFGLRDASITLAQLAQLVGDRPPLASAPLVLLSTPQSTSMTPISYQLLASFFMSRGARGLLGSDYDVPPLFAAEFMRELIGRFAAGDQPLGGLLLELRRAYALQRNNLLGLLYSLYASGDTVVRRKGLPLHTPDPDPRNLASTMLPSDTQPPPL